MPASPPGDSKSAPAANPSAGKIVIFDLLSGPKNSPLDAQKIDYANGTPPGWDAAKHFPLKINDPTNRSTGALSTGIGYGCPPIIGLRPGLTAAQSIRKAGYTDDYIPGANKLLDNSAIGNSTSLYIGGGRTSILAGSGAGGNGAPTNWKVAATVPYTAGYGIGNVGGGGSRDAGAGPAFTGFTIKTVTAPGGVAEGADVEVGWKYRGVVGGSQIAAGAEVLLRDLVVGESVFGSNGAASAVPA